MNQVNEQGAGYSSRHGKIMPDKVDTIIKENKDVWSTRAAFFTFIKGIIRKGWNHHPIKLNLIKKQRKQIPNPSINAKKPTIWGATCAICGEDKPLKDCQVDHVMEETASLTKIEDIQSCAEKLLLVTENDLRILCSDCHSVVSLSQRLGLTFAEAKLEQQVILFKKMNTENQRKMLQSIGICDTISTSAKRVEAYRNYLKENNIERQNQQRGT